MDQDYTVANKTMERINLITCIRVALLDSGYSTVKVVAAVNAALGELKKSKETEKLGSGAANTKRGQYGVTLSVSQKWEGKLTLPLHFDAWHGAVERANKIAEIDMVSIPSVFLVWLDKMKISEPAEQVEVNK